MIDVLWNIAGFVVALGILVFIHEYGHYWVAKKNNVKVLRFAVGFGKPIYSWYNKSGTEFVIGIIPLGGYVRMLDGRVEEVAEHEQKYAFDKKHVLQRISIVAAGPIANFAFAIVLIFIMLLIGVPAVKPVIGDVAKDSPSAVAGLKSGDLITSVANELVIDWTSVQYKLIDQIGEPNFNINIQRDSTVKSFNIEIDNWDVSDGQLLSNVGIVPFSPKPTLIVNYVDETSPAKAAGLRVGDKLISIDGILLLNWQQAVEVIGASAEQELYVAIQRDAEIIELSITPANRQTVEGFSQGYLGIAPSFEEWPKNYVFTNQYDILPAVKQSFVKTWELVELTFNMIGKFITGTIGLENLSGPIAIAQGAGISAQSGLVYFISFMALISVNLGVINLLPLPVLDGGHLMYFIIELIRGKPVSERVQELGFRFGALALMLIMGIALFNDFGRL